MDAEDFSLNNGTDSKVVKDFSAVLPWVSVSVFSNCFIIESIDGCDLSSFVISSEEGNMSWVLEFEAEEKLESLNRVESSINKVSHEDISSVRDLSSLVEQFEEVVELTVDVTTDGNGSLHGLNVALFDKDFLNFLAKDSEFSLGEDGSTLNGLKPVVDV